MMDKRELATALAALRYMQNDMIADGAEWQHGDIATDGGTLKPLSTDEIDALCERLNCAPPARVLIMVEGGNADYQVNGAVEVELIDHDNLEAEGKTAAQCAKEEGRLRKGLMGETQ